MSVWTKINRYSIESSVDLIFGEEKDIDSTTLTGEQAAITSSSVYDPSMFEALLCGLSYLAFYTFYTFKAIGGKLK